MLNKLELNALHLLKESFGGRWMYLVGGMPIERMLGFQIPESYEEHRSRFKDIDVIIPDIEITTRVLKLLIEVTFLSLAGIPVTITPGEENGKYAGLPIARRFIVSYEGGKDIDLLFLKKTYEDPMQAWKDSCDSELVNLTLLKVGYGAVPSPTETGEVTLSWADRGLYKASILKAIANDHKEHSRLLRITGSNARSVKVVNRGLRIKDILTAGYCPGKLN